MKFELDRLIFCYQGSSFHIATSPRGCCSFLGHVNCTPFSPMDPDFISGTDFSFAFDNSNFSDPILRIEIFADCEPDEAGCSSVAEWARSRKRPREDMIFVSGDKDTAHTDIGVKGEEQIMNCNVQETDDELACDYQEEEAAPMIEELPSDHLGNEAGNNGNSARRMDCSTILSIKTIHIASPILAAKSPFLMKLFSNRLRESEQRVVTLRIYASEEAAVVDVLNFMYSSTLFAKTPIELLDVLMIADKFEVVSCMRYCSSLLRNLPMTCEYALLYLDLPFSAEALQPLINAAKQFLAAQYKDTIRFRDEDLKLPLAGIDAVLASNDLQVASEDAVYDFVLKWARLHYPKIDERREIISSRLIRLIRFPYMSCRTLKKVLSCKDFDQELAKEAVLEALFFKADAPYRQRSSVAEEAKTGYRQFAKRAYKYHSIKVVDFELPRKQCIIYMDLKHDKCSQLYPARRIYSQSFHLGGKAFVLSAHCNMDQENTFHCFGLFLGTQEKKSIAFTVDYEFAARSKASKDFVTKYKGCYTFTGGKAVGYRNLFDAPWTKFIAADSPYFINETLHLRVDTKIRHTD